MNNITYIIDSIDITGPAILLHTSKSLPINNLCKYLELIERIAGKNDAIAFLTSLADFNIEIPHKPQ